MLKLLEEIISDNEKQFRDNPFKDWCEKLCIHQCFAFVKHPQANGLIKRANKSLGEGIKARLEKRSKNWLEEISHVLWEHCTMIKSSNGETPFSLTYGMQAVIPVDIDMPTLRTAEVDMIKNDKALKINLHLLEEKREQTVIQEVKSKAKMEKYYNARVWNTSFKPGDLVYRNNEASHVEDGCKLEPKWKGPYEKLHKGINAAGSRLVLLDKVDAAAEEVILNGDSPPSTRIVDGVVQIVAPTTAEQRLAKKNKFKASGTLLMALLDKHQLKFNIHKDAKSLMEDIEKRFGGNKETKRVQKTLLKQQYENFSGTSSESLDQIHDRLQKLISLLEILGETISQEDINLKFLRSLPSEWKTHTLIWRNKVDLEEQSLDDLFNNLKIYEAEVKGSFLSSQNTQNIAFVSSNNTDIHNESIIAAPSISVASSKATVSTLPNVDSFSDVVIYFFFASQTNSPQLDNEDLTQIDPDDLEEIDLKWQMAMLTMRARRFLKRTGRNLGVNGTDTIGFDMSKVECYNCHRRDHFARECRSPWDNMNKETTRRTVPAEVSTSNALVSQCLESVEARLLVYQKNEIVFEEDIKLLKFDVMLRDNALAELRNKFEKAEHERNDLNLTLDKFHTLSKNLSKLLESQVSDKTSLGFYSQVFNSQVFDYEELHSHESDNSMPKNEENDRYKTCEGYHAVPPSSTGTFMPPKPDLVFPNNSNASESVATVFNVDSNTNKPSKDMSKTHRPDAPIVEDWISDSEDETKIEYVPKQREPSFVKSTEHVKSSRESVKKVKNNKQAENLRINNQKVPRENNMYNVDLKNVVPLRGLICLFAKATLDESNLWHRRLGHINFKTMNKLVKGNLVRGLPSRFLKIIILVLLVRRESNIEPLASPNLSVLSANHYKATKDDTSEILKTFITGIENQKNHKAKIIRSDNGTEFKNQDLNQFCGMKGIKREFSVARTPQQNRFAERKNRTLIEAAKTMLGDSLLPIPFWVEAVNTACYVQNRVLVTKPHNKTPYELLLGRSPSIGFMRPFGCPVTILNTLDEGFLVGYSVNCKAFRVFNNRTRIVQETLHINFLENKTNDAGIGPKWMFDIDTLTMSMNYQPDVAGNQPNDNAGIKENLDADDDVADAAFDVKENLNDVHVSANGSDRTDNKKHDEKAKRDDKGHSHVDSPIGVRDLRAKFEEFCFNSSNRVTAVSAPVNDAGPNPTNNTNSFNTANMHELEDIVLDDEEVVGAEADLSNLETNIPVTPIPTTRVHKYHPVNQIIGDLNSAPQTRSMTRMVKEQGGLHQINNEDFHTYLPKGKRVIGSKWVFRNKKDERGIVIRNKARLVAQEHTQEEGIDYDKVFAPVVRIEAIRLFLDYASFMGFMVYQMDVKSGFLYETIKKEVYVCEPPGFEDLDYPDKVYKVVKALYGLHQAPRAWYETLANYLLENDFQRGNIDQTLFIKKQKGDILLVHVYVDDIIFGSTNKELCKDFEKLMKDKFQMSSMGELTFFVRLQVKQKDDGIFISQDKYVAEILRKFGFTYVKSASPPIETKKPLLKDPDGEGVDIHIYRSMIRSLMYLTSSRPDIMFVICACVRFQVTPKVSHLHVVKRIFRYLKGKPHLCLWYPIDSPFNLVAYSDCNYAGASPDRKSTTKGCQFLEAIIRRDIHLDNADGVECLSNEEILAELARMRYEKPPQKLTFYKAFFSAQWKFLIYTLVQCLSAKRTTWNEFSCSIASAVICLATVVMDNQVDDMTTYNTRYTSHTLTQKAEEEVEVHIDPSPPALQDHPSIPHATPPQDQPSIPHASPPQEQPTTTSESFMPLLTTLMETCATLSQKVAELEIDKHSQSLEILQLKKRVKKLEKKKKSKSSGFKRLKRGEAIDADEGITLMDVEMDEEVVAMDAETQGRLTQEDVSAAEPTVFHDEDVTMTMAQILIKLKAEKAKLLDEQIAQRLDDEEVQKATARDKQEKDDMERDLELQKYQNLEVYVDDLVIKSRMEQEVIKDIEETFKTLREINMKLNLKKCTFGMREGTFLGYKVNANGLKVCSDKVEAVLTELPKLTAPKEKEELIIYLATTKEAGSVVLVMERGGKQVPIYIVSRALQGPKINYTPMEKLILSREGLLKWSFELEEHDIHYRPRTSVRGQILANFIVERPEDNPSDTPIKEEEEFSDPWCVGPLQANYVLREITEGSCSMHATLRSVVAKALRSGANKSLGEEIKARLDKRSKNWLEEISHVLWKHRTMIKSSNGETPFSLTYETKAVILVEIGMPTLRTVVRNTSFKPGDLVYQNNEASHAKDGGKLGPKWKGPYEVVGF
nr:hypothetical protein [Tanacetum cinerariifolium]